MAIFSLTYRLTCKLCEAKGVTSQYEGESSKSCYTRGSQHLKNLETRKPGTPLGEHANTYHPGTQMRMDDITMTCTGRYSRPTQRLASEGLAIEKLIKLQKVQGPNKTIIMNSKTNFHQPGMIIQQSAKLSLD